MEIRQATINDMEMLLVLNKEVQDIHHRPDLRGKT